MASGFIRSASFKTDHQEVELTKYMNRPDGVDNVAYYNENHVTQMRNITQGEVGMDKATEDKVVHEEIDGYSKNGHLSQCMTRSSDKLNRPKRVNVQKWLVLLAAVLCRMLGEGYATSMGIYFVEFVEYFQSGRGVTGWAVSLTTGITYGAGIPISFIVYKTNERACCVLGGVIVAVGQIASFFATDIYFLLCTFGIVTGGTLRSVVLGVDSVAYRKGTQYLYTSAENGCLELAVLKSIGMAFIQISFAIAVGRHFGDGRGPATAICETGATVGGMAFPPLLRFLIDDYGWRGSVLVSAGILLNLVAFGLLFSPPNRLKTDNSADRQTEAVKYCDPEIRRTRLFIVYVIVAFIVGVGFFFPYGTIVDIGNQRNYGKERSTYLVIALSVANTIGVFAIAGLIKVFSRHITVLYTLNICLLAASLFVFPVTNSYETLIGAIIFYGVPAGGIYGIYTVVVFDLLGERRYTAGLGFACSAYGLGMALSTPVAGWINEATGDYVKTFYYAGSICSGAALIFGANLLLDRCRKTSSPHLSTTPKIEIEVTEASNPSRQAQLQTNS